MPGDGRWLRRATGLLNIAGEKIEDSGTLGPIGSGSDRRSVFLWKQKKTDGVFRPENNFILFIFSIIACCSRRRSFASLRMTGRGSVILSQRSDSVAPAKNLTASFFIQSFKIHAVKGESSSFSRNNERCTFSPSVRW